MPPTPAAGLPAARASVSVGPPLLARCASIGFMLRTLLAPEVMAAAPLWMRLKSAVTVAVPLACMASVMLTMSLAPPVESARMLLTMVAVALTTPPAGVLP